MNKTRALCLVEVCKKGKVKASSFPQVLPDSLDLDGDLGTWSREDTMDCELDSSTETGDEVGCSLELQDFLTVDSKRMKKKKNKKTISQVKEPKSLSPASPRIL